MLRFTVELVPFGDERNKKLVASGEITNTGERGYYGNYQFVFNAEEWRNAPAGRYAGEVHQFPRMKRNTLALLLECLEQFKDELNR